MSKNTPSPKYDALRAMREALFVGKAVKFRVNAPRVTRGEAGITGKPRPQKKKRKKK